MLVWASVDEFVSYLLPLIQTYFLVFTPHPQKKKKEKKNFEFNESVPVNYKVYCN